MNREIKFRVWETKKARGRMFQWDEIKNGFYSYLNCKETIIMQFVGLMDILTKDAYEGDVIERDASDGKGKVRGLIVFEQGQFRVNWLDKNKGWNNSLYLHLEDSKIIGNIYENPELVNVCQHYLSPNKDDICVNCGNSLSIHSFWLLTYKPMSKQIKGLNALTDENLKVLFADALLNSYSHLVMKYGVGGSKEKSDTSFVDALRSILKGKAFRHIVILYREAHNPDYDLEHWEFGMSSKKYCLSIEVNPKLAEKMFDEYGLKVTEE